MERHQENLLMQLEIEGMKIAKYRKELSNLKHSNQKIEYSEIVHIHSQLTTHIATFDRIHHQLVELEAVI